MNEKTVLVIGPQGTGKSLLILRLRDGISSDSEVKITTPTSGAEPTQIEFETLTSTNSKTVITLLEIGGSFSSIWPSYYNSCCSIVFVVDCFNRPQIPTVVSQICNILKQDSLLTKPILLILNKKDLLSSYHSSFHSSTSPSSSPAAATTVESISTLEQQLRIEDLNQSRLKLSQTPLSVLSISSLTCENLKSVQDWLKSL